MRPNTLIEEIEIKLLFTKKHAGEKETDNGLKMKEAKCETGQL